MKHLSELLERLNRAKTSYKEADSSLDGGSLAFVLAHQELKAARFEFSEACVNFVVENILNKEEEIENV